MGGFGDEPAQLEREGRATVYLYHCPVDTKANQALLREAVDTYKVGGLLFSGGKMQTQAILTNQAQRMARLPLMITLTGNGDCRCAFAVLRFFRAIGIGMYTG